MVNCPAIGVNPNNNTDDNVQGIAKAKIIPEIQKTFYFCNFWTKTSYTRLYKIKANKTREKRRNVYCMTAYTKTLCLTIYRKYTSEPKKVGIMCTKNRRSRNYMSRYIVLPKMLTIYFAY